MKIEQLNNLSRDERDALVQAPFHGASEDAQMVTRRSLENGKLPTSLAQVQEFFERSLARTTAELNNWESGDPALNGDGWYEAARPQRIAELKKEQSLLEAAVDTSEGKVAYCDYEAEIQREFLQFALSEKGQEFTGGGRYNERMMAPLYSEAIETWLEFAQRIKQLERKQQDRQATRKTIRELKEMVFGGYPERNHNLLAKPVEGFIQRRINSRHQSL